MALYKPSEHFATALKSALNQTYSVKEVILVNDGGPEDYFRSVLPDDNRIRVYTKPNGGVASARNAAIGYANGELIAMLDQDDYWFENKLETQLKYYAGAPGILVAPIKIITENERVYRKKNSRAYGHYRRAVRVGEMREALLRGNFVYSSTPLIHRKVFTIGGFCSHADPHDDWEFYLRAVFSGFPLILCGNQPLSVWRVHEGNESGDLLKMLRTKCRVLRKYVCHQDKQLAHIARREYAIEASRRAHRILYKRGKRKLFSRVYFGLLGSSLAAFRIKLAARALYGLVRR